LARDDAHLQGWRAALLRALHAVDPTAHCQQTPGAPACGYHLLTAVLDAAAMVAARRADRPHGGTA
jgi:hypothetical protein